MVKEKGIKTKEVKLNNKSRKGNYFYVKESGKRGKYFKKSTGLTEEDYKEIYREDGLRQKRGGVTKEKLEAIRVHRKKKLLEIETILKDGYTQTTIERAEKITPFGMKTAYMNLLRNSDKVGDKLGVVRDKELLNIITRPEDVEKWKHRIFYKIELYGDKGLAGILTNQYPKSLGIVMSEVKAMTHLGTGGGEINYQAVFTEAGKKGYNFEKMTRENFKGMKIKMVFRKGK